MAKYKSRAHEGHCSRTFGADPSFSFKLVVTQGRALCKHITLVKHDELYMFSVVDFLDKVNNMNIIICNI